MTDETYTGGASYDGTGSQRGSVAEPNGEGRERIPELLRNPGNGGERNLARALWVSGTPLEEVKYYVDF